MNRQADVATCNRGTNPNFFFLSMHVAICSEDSTNTNFLNGIPKFLISPHFPSFSFWIGKHFPEGKEKQIFFPPKMSSEPEDKAPSFSSPKSVQPSLNPQHSAAAFMMDLDLDLESSCSLDQIFANPMSSFLLSNSEQPCSPLWAFTDEYNDCKPAGNYVSSGGFSHSNCSRLMSCMTLLAPSLLFDFFFSLCVELLAIKSKNSFVI